MCKCVDSPRHSLLFFSPLFCVDIYDFGIRDTHLFESLVITQGILLMIAYIDSIQDHLCTVKISQTKESKQHLILPVLHIGEQNWYAHHRF